MKKLLSVILLFLTIGFSVCLMYLSPNNSFVYANEENGYLHKATISINQYSIIFKNQTTNFSALNFNNEMQNNYTGSYIDAEGYLNIGIKTTYLQNFKSLSRVKKAEELQNLKYINQQYSYKFLHDIFSSLTTLNYLDITIGIDQKLNKIIIEYSDKKTKEIVINHLQTINQYYADTLIFKPVTKNNFDYLSDYAYGGSTIYYNGFLGIPTGHATMGFCAYQNSTGKYGIVTNAHVAKASANTTYKLDGGIEIGKKLNSQQTGTIDAAFIEISNPSLLPSPDIKMGDNNFWTLNIASPQYTIIQGAPIVKSGKSSGVTYGTILYTDYTLQNFYNCIKISNYATDGDSGSPVVSNDSNQYLLGLVFAKDSDETNTVVCRASNILNNFDLQLVNQDYYLSHPEIW
jgi:hypothetical protein